MTKESLKSSISQKISFQSFLLSFWTCSGYFFFIITRFSGIDAHISPKEGFFAAVSTSVLFLLCLFLYSSIPGRNWRNLLYIVFCALTLSWAIRTKAPELMRLPISVPAENGIEVLEMEPQAQLWLDWAYWFRPRSLKEDPFFWEPDSDISFSSFGKTGEWQSFEKEGKNALFTEDPNASLLLPKAFRNHLAVFCLHVSNGTVKIKEKGSEDPITLTPENFSESEYRLILKGGLLPEPFAFLLQWLLWGGLTLFLITAGVFLCTLIKQRYRADKDTFLLYTLAFLLPCFVLVSLCWLLKLFPFGEKTFLINDMWVQYSDFLAYLRTVISGENSLFYSFSKCIGDDMVSLYAYYLANPINWIVCFFPPIALPKVITILVIIRFALAGLTSAIYFHGRQKTGFSTLLFSTCYALTAFQFVNTENIELREGAIIFPLVIMGLEQLLDGNSGRLFRAALSVSILLNYYSAFQICVFCVIYFLFYCELKPVGIPFRNRLKSFIRNSLLSALYVAWFLVPVIVQLRGGPKTFSLSNLSFTIKENLAGFWAKFLNSAFDKGEIGAGGLPCLYCGLIVFLLIPLFFANRKFSKREKILTFALLFVMIMMMQVDAFDLFMHGLNNPIWWNYRYSFCTCFLLIIIASRCWAERVAIPIKAVIIDVIIMALIIVLGYRNDFSWLSRSDIEMNLLLSVCLIMILPRQIQNKSDIWVYMLSVMALFDLMINGYHILSIGTAFTRSNTISDYKKFFETNIETIDLIKASDDGFYRIEKTYYRSPNDSMLLSYNGLSHYSSTLKYNVMDFLKRSGFLQYHYRIQYWNGSTALIDSLLGIKYLITDPEIVKPYPLIMDSDNFHVHQNPYALPLAFPVENSALSSKGEGEGWELQEKILSAMTGEEENVVIPAKVKDFRVNGMTVSQKDNDFCYFTEADGNLEWNLLIERNDPLYTFIPADNVNPVLLQIGDNRTIEYFYNFSGYVQYLGTFEPGTELKLRMTPHGDTICLHDAQFFYEDHSSLETVYNKLNRYPAAIRKENNTLLTGEVSIPEDKLLFFSIPYDKGWHIRVDGKPVQAVPVFNVFMGVPLTAGEHEFSLHYIPQGMIPGIILSVLTLVVSMGAEGIKKDDLKVV